MLVENMFSIFVAFQTVLYTIVTGLVLDATLFFGDQNVTKISNLFLPK